MYNYFMFDTKSQQILFVAIALVIVVSLFSTGNLFNFGNINEGLVLSFTQENLFSELANDKEAKALLNGRVYVSDLMEGNGKEVVEGSTVSIRYTGELSDGTVFDNLYEEEDLEFIAGVGKIIPGVDVGLIGMKVGGKRSIVVAPEYAYGEKGFGAIPGNSIVIFDVSLVAVK